jgi:aspartate aminotransferase
MKVTALVSRLRQSGVDVIDLGAGEPDFPTLVAAKAAAHQAIDADFTKYTPNAGTVDLRRAICERYRADYGVAYTEAEVIATAGGKQALFNAAMALFGPGDEVVLHSPHWPTLPEQIALAQATPVFCATSADDGFAIRAERILDKITPRTRGILINSPCNPTGAIISEPDFERVADTVAARGLWLVVDLCYEQLIYERTPHNLPGIIARRCRDHGVICGSVSKAYAMTGWRCGWAIGPSAVIAACDAVQSHSTSNASSITQKAAAAALSGSQAPVRVMLDEYRVRRDRLHEWLVADPRLRCVKPRGAFYLFVDVGRALGADGVTTSAEFAEALLEQMQVAVTPGEAFGAPGFVRLSYATSMDNLREGSRRIVEFVRAHSRPVPMSPA